MTIELVWACDEERRRKHAEENVEDGYIREKEDRTTKTRWKDVCQQEIKTTEMSVGKKIVTGDTE